MRVLIPGLLVACSVSLVLLAGVGEQQQLSSQPDKTKSDFKGVSEVKLKGSENGSPIQLPSSDPVKDNNARVDTVTIKLTQIVAGYTAREAYVQIFDTEAKANAAPDWPCTPGPIKHDTDKGGGVYEWQNVDFFTDPAIGSCYNNFVVFWGVYENGTKVLIDRYQGKFCGELEISPPKQVTPKQALHRELSPLPYAAYSYSPTTKLAFLQFRR